MEEEVSLYHQLIEHPVLVFLVASLLLVALMYLLGTWVLRRSERRVAESEKNGGPEEVRRPVD